MLILNHFHFVLKELTKHLVTALKVPTDKFAFRFAYIPSGRFLEDYYGRLKFASLLKILGFSINPEHLQCNNNYNIRSVSSYL